MLPSRPLTHVKHVERAGMLSLDRFPFLFQSSQRVAIWLVFIVTGA